MTDPIESPEAFAERICDGWVLDGKTSLADVIASLIRARDAAVSAFAVERRDRDWLLAMADALGTGSGYRVPLVPESEPFRELFAAVRREALREAARVCDVAADDYRNRRTTPNWTAEDAATRIRALADSEEP